MTSIEYKATKTWFINSDIHKNLLNYVHTGKHNILEIGCFEGLSSVFFARYLLNHKDSKMTCVDPFLSIEGNDHSKFLANEEEKNFDYNISVCPNSEKITVLKTTSDNFFKRNLDTFTFIYVDGCHEHDYITRDMENSFSYLEKGGIMWMDDYRGDDGRNMIPMDAFLEKYKGKYELIHKGYQLAIKRIV